MGSGTQFIPVGVTTAGLGATVLADNPVPGLVRDGNRGCSALC